MKKVMLALVLFVLGVAALTAYTGTLPTLSNEQWSIELKGETILFNKDPMGRIAIYNELTAKTPEGLEAYRARSRERLNKLPAGVKKGAIVTFVRPLSEQEVLSIVPSEIIGALTFTSYPQGGGSHLYPLTAEDRAQMQKDAAEWRDWSLKYNHEDFRLFDGYISAAFSTTPDVMKRIASDPNVLSVEVGAVEYLDKYPNARLQVSEPYYVYKQVLDASSKAA